MSFFNFLNKVNKLESSITEERDNLKEITEKNLKLEKEIKERTEEINKANDGLLTLSNVWESVNSSEPVKETISTIVEGFNNNEGYIYAFYADVVDREKLLLKEYSKNDLAQKVNIILDSYASKIEIPFCEKSNIIVDSLLSREIKTTNNFTELFNMSNIENETDKIKEIKNLFEGRKVIILPVVFQGRSFGAFVLVSIRNYLTEMEESFLNLFGGQLELAITIAKMFEQIKQEATTDPLTGLYNRRHFDKCMRSEADRAKRTGQVFSLISIDLDHLKKINDTLGHSAGDAAIFHIGRVLKQNARSIDVAARMGGEEFSVLLPDVDDEGAFLAAERIRHAIEDVEVEGVGIITGSLGVATFLKHTDDLDEITELVDQAMYRAKKNGRNRSEMASREDINWKELTFDKLIEILRKQHAPIPENSVNELIERAKNTENTDEDLPSYLFSIINYMSEYYQPLYQRKGVMDKTNLIIKIAHEMKLSDVEINKLKGAALLYDIGNLLLPENILLKQDKLTAEEQQTTYIHPLEAAKEILKPLKAANPIIDILENHKENFDGTGYPGVLSGNEIPLASRILIVVDAYYAMISDRPHRKAMTKQEAINVLKQGAGSKWDENLVEILIKNV